MHHLVIPTLFKPSSNIISASFEIFTNPCVIASARTAWVETTTWTSFKTASQIIWFVQSSTLSRPVNARARTAGMFSLMTWCC